MFTNLSNTFSTANKTGPTDMFRKISKLVFYQKLSTFFRKHCSTFLFKERMFTNLSNTFSTARKTGRTDMFNCHSQLTVSILNGYLSSISQLKGGFLGHIFEDFFFKHLTMESIDGNPTSR